MDKHLSRYINVVLRERDKAKWTKNLAGLIETVVEENRANHAYVARLKKYFGIR